MFGFTTHGLLFAFIASWFWIAGVVGYTARAFYLTTAIGFFVGGITYFSAKSRSFRQGVWMVRASVSLGGCCLP